MSSRSEEFEQGDRLGDFEIVRRIGRGGMGSVYLADDTRLGRRIALKVILPELAEQPDFRRRFEVEARGAAAIEHPNLVPVYSAGLIDGRLYLAMRYVEGENLNEALDRTGPLSAEMSSRIIGQIASALDAAHAAGLVHRDVTPANILLEGELGSEGVYLTDFGLVRGLDTTETQITRTNEVIANLDYAAPEQIQGDRVDARTDVYSLGCVLYRMRSGSRPFPGTNTQKMWKIVNEPVPSIGGGRDPLDSVIARATAKAPDERFPSAGDLARATAHPGDAVTERLSEQSVATGPAASGYFEGLDRQEERTEYASDLRDRPTAVIQSPGSGGRNRMIAAGAGVVAFIVGAVVAVVLISSGGKTSGSRTVIREETVTAPAEVQAESSAKPTSGSAAQSASTSRSELNPFFGQAYVTQVPAGWQRDEGLVEEAPYYPSLWRAPNDPGEPYMRVEGNSPAQLSDPVAAGEESRSNTSESTDYREIFYGSDVLGGRHALRWEYEVEGDRRIVFAFVECNVNLAVVGSSSPASFSEYAGLFDDIARATRARCSGSWPGGTAYTAILASVQAKSEAHQYSQEASEVGLAPGILYSSDYSSLRPGYWVVFSGSFSGLSEAELRAEEAQELGFDGAYPRLVEP